MKVALLVSGQPRFYKETFEFTKKEILDKYDCDVYIHSWWSLEEATTGNSYWSNTSKKSAKPFDKNFPDEVLKLYKPKKIIIEPSLIAKESDCTGSFLNTLQKMYPGKNSHKYDIHKLCAAIHRFISLEKAYELLLNSKQNYDWIIYWRFDALVEKFLDLNKINTKGLHAFTDEYKTFEDDENYFNDIGWVVHWQYKQIFKMATFYTNVVNETIEFDYTEMVTPECVWKTHALYNKVPIIKHPTEHFNLKLFRG